jgi:hypothetical protein
MKTYTIKREITDFYEVKAESDEEALRTPCPKETQARACLSIIGIKEVSNG